MKSVRLANEVRLAFEERGDAGGPAVLLVHGITDSHLSFRGVMDAMPPHMRVVAVTQRGHGDSDRPESGYRTRDFAGDLALFMDELGLERAVVVGHSMGAANALRLAMDVPSPVRGLVLAGAFSTFAGNAGLVEFYETVVRPLADPVPEALAREFQMSTLAQPVEPAFLEMVIAESLKAPALVWRGAFAGLLEDDFATELGRVAAPAILVWGDRDAMSSREDQEALLKGLRRAELLVYEGAGHAAHWEEPARFAQDVVRFVDSL